MLTLTHYMYHAPTLFAITGSIHSAFTTHTSMSTPKMEQNINSHHVLGKTLPLSYE